ncbi:hypothetical protein F5148DRAFT_1333998 [Russula earlei]|uniref:Uncharacterized protein n=1 Tax=Russula earlei TaxID=71964 RepID=A0ACC0TVY1_9AGAM|nr:hypothetical protein F5148DRAFT_1333998 [Russula earlei]
MERVGGEAEQAEEWEKARRGVGIQDNVERWQHVGQPLSVWQCEGKVDVLLGVKADHKQGDIYDFLSYSVVVHVKQSDHYPMSQGCWEQATPDVTLSDQNSCMVDALHKAKLEYLCLQAAFQEVFDLKSKHEIKSHVHISMLNKTHKLMDEPISLEQTFWVFVIELEQLTSGMTDF